MAVVSQCKWRELRSGQANSARCGAALALCGWLHSVRLFASTHALDARDRLHSCRCVVKCPRNLWRGARGHFSFGWQPPRLFGRVYAADITLLAVVGSLPGYWAYMPNPLSLPFLARYAAPPSRDYHGCRVPPQGISATRLRAPARCSQLRTVRLCSLKATTLACAG
jgi:hypothetical protein